MQKRKPQADMNTECIGSNMGQQADTSTPWNSNEPADRLKNRKERRAEASLMRRSKRLTSTEKRLIGVHR